MHRQNKLTRLWAKIKRKTVAEPSNKRIDSHEDTQIAVSEVQLPASTSSPVKESALKGPETKQTLNEGEPPQKTASDQDSASSLLKKACQELSKDEEILHKYRKNVLLELKKNGLVGDGSSSLDIGQTTELLKSRVDSPKGKEILNNIAKALSTSLQLLSPAASIEPHVALVCTGLSIIMLPLSNMVQQQNDLLDGLDLVSMMMLRSNSVGHELARKPDDPVEVQETQNELRERVIKLYTLIIKFQIQAASSFCRSDVIQAVRDTAKIDDWKGMLEPIIRSEKFCWDLINKINADRSKRRSDRQDLAEQNQELDRLLNLVTLASFDDHEISQVKRECLGNTRTKLLENIMEWSMNRRGEYIFWLNGRAGTGKSTIAMTVCRRLSDEGRLGANFFFSRQQNQGYSRHFFTTLASQLANLSPEFRSLISNAIAGHHDFAQKEFRQQWQWLLLEPLSKCQSYWAPIVIVIDALDECDTDGAAKYILDLLTEYENPGHLPLRILITSRPEVSAFSKIRKPIRKVNLHDEQDSEKDVLLFLEDELGRIRKERGAEADWPGKTKTEHLAQKSRDLFIHAATSCRFIDVEIFYDENLSKILERDTSDLGGLHDIYTQVLETAAFHDIPETKREESQTKLNEIISAVVALLSPLSVSGLSKFLDYPEAQLKAYLRKLGSVIAVSDDGSQVKIFHLSFRDFFLDVKREDKRFCTSELEIHRNLLDRCLEIMSVTLKMDICYIKQVDYLPNSDDQNRITKFLPEHVQYACRYWVRHVQQSDGLQHEDVLRFLQDHFLHWLEALSLLGRVSEAVLMIAALHNMPSLRTHQGLLDLVCDARLFLTSLRSIVKTPLQIYHSAIIFSPANSLIRKLFLKSKDFSQSLSKSIKVLPLLTDWDTSVQACRHVLEGHSSSVTTVAFSADGLLASGSYDNTVRVWDPATGQCKHELKGHSRSVNTVAFSADGLLASGSKDNTVRVWDPATGQCKHELKGHSGWVNTVAFSADGLLASGSYDNTVRVWDPATGQCKHELKGHSHSVNTVAFSADGLLASGSGDNTVRVWDPATGQCKHELKGHSRSVKTVAFSADGLLASGSHDNTVRVWDPATGQCKQELKGHSGWVTTVAFSADGLLASGSQDNTVRVWDPATGQCKHELKGHSSSVYTVAFSADGLLASGSKDNTVRVWDPATGQCKHELKGHSGWVNTVAFSADGLLASGSQDNTVRVWDPATGQCKHELKGHSRSVNTVAFSADGLLASGSEYNIVRVWDPATGQCKHELKGHSDWVNTVAFSADGLLASGSRDNTVRVWDPATGQCKHELKGHSSSVYTVAFSADGLLASGSSDNTVRVWDPATGQCKHELEDLTLMSEGQYLFLSDSISPLFSLNAERTWVIKNNCSIISIPDTYHRSTAFAIRGNIMALGYVDGRLIFLQFSEAINI